MGILRGLLGLGVTAGAAFAAVKVAQKYSENRDSDAEAAASGEEPEEVPAGSVLSDIGRAAGDVLMDAGAKIKAAAQKAGVDTDELKGAFVEAGSAVAHAGGAVVDYVKQEAPEKFEQVRDSARDVLSHVKEVVSTHVSFDEDDEEYDVQAEADAAQAEADEARAEADAAQAEADAARAYADAVQAEADAAADDEDEEDEDKL